MMRSNWLYGIILGVLLILLQAINYKVIIRDISIELYGLIIGIIFAGIGIWVGTFWVRKENKLKFLNRRKGIYELSGRELEVLNAMAEGLSNQEIADSLFVSLNTIKTHSSKIYSKLNVQRRTQAIQKARDLDLID